MNSVENNLDDKSVPLTERTRPRARTLESLLQLLEILQCPETGELVQLSEDGQQLVTDRSRRIWHCMNFVPNMFANFTPATFSSEHLSNDLADRARVLIENADGLVLNLSAGGSRSWFPNVVEVEAAIFRNTDIIADAHKLPFRDEVFSACVAMNSFEHYHSPHLVAEEIFRVLKPGGQVLIHTAFIQPLHEAPFHFYNATPFGVMKWFEKFQDVHTSVSYNFNPVFALSWWLSELDLALRAEGNVESADRLTSVTLEEMMQFWRFPERRRGEIWDIFLGMSAESQQRLSAGVEMVARKV